MTTLTVYFKDPTIMLICLTVTLHLKMALLTEKNTNASVHLQADLALGAVGHRGNTVCSAQICHLQTLTLSNKSLKEFFFLVVKYT